MRRVLIVSRFTVYVCNCNAIRERDALNAIQSGASTPKAVFAHCQSRPQCAKCVCDIRDMINEASITMAMAAE
jgi:bacterioferritin-associated ferredoxin